MAEEDVRAVLWIASMIWAWGFGYFSHDSSPSECVLLILWPITLPLGIAYHRWRFGRHSQRYIYRDTRWWQRGDKTRREVSGG